MDEKPGYIFKVPNTEEGDLFRSLARKFLNKKTYRLSRRGRDDKPIHKACMHRYYLSYKDSNNDLQQMTAHRLESCLNHNLSLIRHVQLMAHTFTRKIIIELMRVCSEDEDLTDVAEKLERLYVAKTLLGEE